MSRTVEGTETGTAEIVGTRSGENTVTKAVVSMKNGNKWIIDWSDAWM